MLLPIRSVPALHSVDSEIFTLRYFQHCMQCTFCHDSCCQYGCDVNVGERDRLLELKTELEPFLGIPATEWFKSEVFEDPEYPTGKFVRANTKNWGLCLPQSQGARLRHSRVRDGDEARLPLDQADGVLAVPVCWDKGVMRPNSDVKDDLACKGDGPIIYDLARDEIAVVFGKGLVDELDALRLTC
jgi:hypothetical protein